jgi:60 kDa SS-A/Ro ribonucleoprotein
MANKSLFSRSIRGKATNTVNSAGGAAYTFEPRHALAQYAATGCLNGTFYASATKQLDSVMALCDAVEPEFIARTALYARKTAHMKDLPALLCAVLSVKSPGLLAEVFDRVIDRPKMVRNFVQIMRSGVVGRRSLGTLPKRLIHQWLDQRSDAQVFYGTVGQDPSMVDIIRMVHPKPLTASRDALYGYLLGREYDPRALPDVVKDFERFKRNTNPGKLAVPDVPFQMLTGLDLVRADWKGIARQASWQMTRMNLNTFIRHGVFEDRELTRLIAKRLCNRQLIEKARVFPYQLMVAYKYADRQLPDSIRQALHEAMEIAVWNVPRISGKVFVCLDVSGSMHGAITGHRPGATSVVRCIDVAALIAASIMRVNPQTVVVPFESSAVPPERAGLNPADSIMTNARKLASLPAGGTNCSAAMKYLNKARAEGCLVIYVSDNESWVDSPNYGWMGGNATATMHEWQIFKKRNPEARMVCIDLQPNSTTQVVERSDIINVGGFSDAVFHVITAMARGRAGAGYWVDQITQTRL